MLPFSLLHFINIFFIYLLPTFLSWHFLLKTLQVSSYYRSYHRMSLKIACLWWWSNKICKYTTLNKSWVIKKNCVGRKREQKNFKKSFSVETWGGKIVLWLTGDRTKQKENSKLVTTAERNSTSSSFCSKLIRLKVIRDGGIVEKNGRKFSYEQPYESFLCPRPKDANSHSKEVLHHVLLTLCPLFRHYQ